MPDPNKIKVPPLRRKGRSIIEVGPESLGAAVRWDRLARDLVSESEAAPQTAEGGEAPDRPASKL